MTAFLRIEDANGQQSYLNQSKNSTPSDPSPISSDILENNESTVASSAVSSSESLGAEPSVDPKLKKKKKKKSKVLSGSRIRKALRNLSSPTPSTKGRSPSPESSLTKSPGTFTPITTPPPDHRRVLYSANAGDARGVLCRGGKAVRLTYDHKGSDKQEAKRITDAGGFVMAGRVNGVLAVTRSLGDTSMKEFVVGSPYTTETELCDEDEFLILACDGVRFHFSDRYFQTDGLGSSSGISPATRVRSSWFATSKMRRPPVKPFSSTLFRSIPLTMSRSLSFGSSTLGRQDAMTPKTQKPCCLHPPLRKTLKVFIMPCNVS